MSDPDLAQSVNRFELFGSEAKIEFNALVEVVFANRRHAPMMAPPRRQLQGR
jgi:hypothetical protein